MTLSAEQHQELAKFPPALKALIEAELAAGNTILQIVGGFPAPPAGACVKLARKVSTRPRGSGDGLDFYERNYPGYSGEFTDAKRHFFVLEPPLPPPPPPDMDALRAQREARQRAADAALIARGDRESKRLRAQRRPIRQVITSLPPAPPSPLLPLVERFRQSMEINYERWHDGTGYDLELLRSATDAERAQIEQLLLSGGIQDWRDVEALAALDSPRATEALRGVFRRGDDRLNVALLSHAPKLFTDRERTDALVSALRNTGFYGGLTQALLLVEDWHPAPVIEALLRGVLERDGATAGSFVALLLFLHGQATSAYDMEQRPFCLKFQDGDRRALFGELCDRIGVDRTTQRRLLAMSHG